ncbi:MAG: phosphate ABC transporter permease subunit PstC [Firmicutes bacterium]|nr:phosphate ABC transporter permease subunit PstC [Sporosalibacterium faouarense]MTI49062.1 phosphate ABC transporter permease subunit PstC [Bacillota bacterium]
MSKSKWTEIWEKIVEIIFFLSACMAIVSIAIITFFIFIKGVPAIAEIGLFDFIFKTDWYPEAEILGIGAMIVASIYATLGSIIIGVPIGLLTAVFIAELAPDWMIKIIKPAVELLAGIPSVVYGFFGLVIIVPIIDRTFGGGGNGLLAAIIILSFMILPTIINISVTALKAVPREYKEGSLAMGASHIQTIFKVMIPAAKSGIFAAIILGIGRAIGETMAVILVAGNSIQIPFSILDRVRPMTAHIALEMSYAAPGLHENSLFATGVILFIFIMILNIVLNFITSKVGE